MSSSTAQRGKNLPIAVRSRRRVAVALLLVCNGLLLAYTRVARAPHAAAAIAWQDEDYSEVFTPLMRRYGSAPISRQDFSRFSEERFFGGFDTNHDNQLDAAEYQRVFLYSLQQSSWEDGPQR